VIVFTSFRHQVFHVHFRHFTVRKWIVVNIRYRFGLSVFLSKAAGLKTPLMEKFEDLVTRYPASKEQFVSI
jgi:hypothetical protein